MGQKPWLLIFTGWRAWRFVFGFYFVTQNHAIVKHIWNATAVAFTNAFTPYWAHSCIVVVTDIHHPNTLWIDTYESNAECYCLELTVINVALNSCSSNAVPSWLSQEGTGVKTPTSAWACFESFLSNDRRKRTAGNKVGAATTVT